MAKEKTTGFFFKMSQEESELFEQRMALTVSPGVNPSAKIILRTRFGSVSPGFVRLSARHL